MLFYLDDSLIADPADPEFHTINMCVRKLAESVSEGHHLLMGSYEVISHFNKVFQNVGEDISSLFNQMEKYEDFRDIPNELTYYVEIVRNDPQLVRTEGKKTIAQVNYKNFEKTPASQCTVLLGEDTRDCAYYREILGWYKRNINPTNLRHCFEDMLGGGGQTHDQIKRVKGRKRPCLAIVDTDKKYPTQSIDPNSTGGKCISIPRTPLYELIVLDVQEIENLIPNNHLCLYQFNGQGAANKLHFDSYIGYDDTEELMQFYDYKDGIKKADIKDKPVYKAFAEKFYAHNTIINHGQTFEEYLNTLGDDDCVIPGLQKNILEKVRETIAKTRKDAKYQEPVLFKFQEREWRRIGEAMLNWGCSHNTEAIII